MKILVTRPAQQSSELCEEIRKLNHVPLLFPTIEIIPPRNLSPCLEVTKHLDKFAVVIFTSANTMLYLPEIKKNNHTKILAIGPGTASALQQHNIIVDHVAPPPFTSEALLRLPELQQVAGVPVAIMTGADSRPFLAQMLRQRGAMVKSIITYQRKRPAYNAKGLEKIQDIDMIVITSQQSLRNLMILARQWHDLVLTKILLVAGEKLAALAKELGFKKIITAANATNTAIIAALTGV